MSGVVHLIILIIKINLLIILIHLTHNLFHQTRLNSKRILIKMMISIIDLLHLLFIKKHDRTWQFIGYLGNVYTLTLSFNNLILIINSVIIK